MRQHTVYDELCDRARQRGLEVGLVVPIDRPDAFRRDVTQIRLTRRDTPKGVAINYAPATLETLDQVAAKLLKALP